MAPTVLQLVERFEQWERGEKEKLKKELLLATGDPPAEPPVEDPVTPRGQVRRLRDQLEKRCMEKNTTTRIPAKKTDVLRRVPTSYYQKSDGTPRMITTPTEVAYVHVDAVWDEETSCYWTKSHTGDWVVYDEVRKEFTAPAANMKPPRQADLDNTQIVAAADQSSTPGSGEWDPTDTPRGVVAASLATPQIPATDVAAPKAEDRSAEDIQAEKEKFENGFKRIASETGVPCNVLKKFHLGVQLYALVKSNGGMLKPVIVHLAVDRGKIYIVRHGKSRFLSINHFSECDSRENCIDFISKETSMICNLQETINSLRQQPMVVLWTSDKFSEDTPLMTNKKRNNSSKGMAFVFDTKQLRDEFCSVLSTMSQQSGSPITFRIS